MTHADSVRLVAGLVAAFPGTDVHQDTVSVYVRAVEKLAEEPARRAVAYLVATSARFPSIAALVEETVVAAEGLPSAAAAWEMVARVEKDLPPVVRRALEAVGGRWAVRTAENTVALRAQFLRMYEDFRREAVAAAAGVASDAVASPAAGAIGEGALGLERGGGERAW